MSTEYRRIARVTNLKDGCIMAIRAAMLLLAGIWRRLMFRTTFICVTGSVGKTTAKNCMAAVLSSRFPTLSTRGSHNHYRGIFDNVFRVRPWHRFAVIEVAIDGPGQMKWFGKALRPDIAVWLGVARTHFREYSGLEQIADEKAKLVEAVVPGGAAILNDDDPLVHDFRPPDQVRAIRFGTGEASGLGAINVSSIWPEQLSFDVCWGGERAHVATQLVGSHWVSSALAAIAVALECGMSLPEAVAPLQKVQPTLARLSPAPLPTGAVFLRDEFNGSIDTWEPALQVLEQAQAGRKILVISDVSDSGQKSKHRAVRLGADAARVADLVVFVGELAEQSAARAMRAGMPVQKAHAFLSLPEAADFLRDELRSGDVVLLRGRVVDKMSRMYLAQTREVTCWLPACNRKGLCDSCPELSRRPVSVTIEAVNHVAE